MYYGHYASYGQRSASGFYAKVGRDGVTETHHVKINTYIYRIQELTQEHNITGLLACRVTSRLKYTSLSYNEHE